MKAKSIKGRSPEEIQNALDESLADGFKPTLAIVFISVKQDRKAVCEILKAKEIDVFGATSCGEFINSHQSEGEIVVLLLDLSKELYTIIYEEIGNRSIEEVSIRVAKEALQKFKDPSLIICSTGMNAKGEYFDGESLVKHIDKAIGPDRIFFGGMAGDDMTFTGTYVFTHSNETDDGIVTLVLDSNKIALSGMAITGWKPMGISRTVTKSIGNNLYAIDGKPAVEMYLKYLGKEEKKSDKDFNVFEELGYTYPFITERETGGETVLRSPLKIDHKENALQLEIGMPEGTKFWFAMPPDFEIVDEILNEATQLKNANNNEADALLIFSCAGRPPVLGPLVTAENNGLADVWKTPMAGFFTYGEYGRAKKGKQEFHSGACCWVALKEK
ncbi:MAG TPA: FIST N-terminal domain-containing protein [Chitinophagaceae bacterium]|nr:FIST N-terminal domain-containing protein [Chitinophagaceae bacterium]